MADSASPEQLRARLSRIEGQIRGIAKMLESDRPCEDVVTQLMAVRSGIDNVGALMLDTHLGNCIGNDDAAHRVESLRDSMRMWWRFAPGAAGFGAVPTDGVTQDGTTEATPAPGPGSPTS
jgi:DNA-binding FrmR family transcriptional regulator